MADSYLNNTTYSIVILEFEKNYWSSLKPKLLLSNSANFSKDL